MTNEQWKSGGNCSKCRRQKYCSHECRERRNRLRRELEGVVVGKFSEALCSGVRKTKND